MNILSRINNIKMLPMVSWFNLKQLANTAYESIVSKLIGSRADRRLMLALAAPEKEFYNYTRFHRVINGRVEPVEESKRKEIWLDFIADTGEGWDSTYSVAYYSSKPRLNIKDGGEAYNTQRGNILIFGGDEVYPTPSRKAYRERLLAPYGQAFGDDAPADDPHVFAIPGNHDWYDGLEAFTRLFCSDLGSRRFAGGWYTRQKRSYFALKLPCGWWLLGSDGQLHSNIDTSQLEYFRNVADNHMKEGDKVILCIAEPMWIFAHKYKKFGALYDESDLIFLQEEILAPKNIEVKVFLAGDLHHYRRHEEINAEDSEAKTQKITAGGGGAFLHPTHGFDFSVISEDKQLPGQKPRDFELKKSYPDEKTSKSIGWSGFLFPLFNPGFGLLTGTLYLVTIWIVSSTFDFEFPKNLGGYIDYTFRSFIYNPLSALWLIVVALGFVFFTDTHSTIYRWAGAFLHTALHFFSMFYIGLLATFLGGKIFPHGSIELMFIAVIIFGLGWIIGSFNMGIYLTVSMNVFGRHDNEAFSALKIKDYKNFLRLHINEEGTLTIYPVKIERAATRWRKRKEGENDNAFIIPEDGSVPELIEKPIVIKKR